MDSNYGYNSAFPTRLRKLMDEANISQQEIADFIGVSRQAVAQWKDGKTIPDMNNFKRTAEFFNVPYEYLLGDTDSAVKENIEIADALGLSDKAIQFLKEQRKKDTHNNSDILGGLIVSLLLEKADFGQIIEYIQKSAIEYITDRDWEKDKLFHEVMIRKQLNGLGIVGDEYFLDHSYLEEAKWLARKEGKRVIDASDMSDFYMFKASELWNRIVEELPRVIYEMQEREVLELGSNDV